MSDEWLIRNPEADAAPSEATPEAAPQDAQDSAPARIEPDPERDPAAEEPQATLDAEEPLALVAPAPPGPRCPYCREALHEVVAGHQDEAQAAERTVACAECQTPVHARCVQIHGGCVTNGCSGRSFAFVESAPRPQIRAARIARPRRRARAPEPREPRQVPECPRDWVRRDAPLLVLGLVGILSLALFGDSLAEGARRFGELHAALTTK